MLVWRVCCAACGRCPPRCACMTNRSRRHPLPPTASIPSLPALSSAVSSVAPSVTEIAGYAFESEAVFAFQNVLKNLCPWLDQPSQLQQGRDIQNLKWQTSRDADIFCYLSENSQKPCQSLPSKGLRVVTWTPALAAVPPLTLPAGSSFSPYDASRKGPQKYLLAEAYSGEKASTREQKVTQLESLISFTKQRWEDRTGRNVDDVTSIVGVAGLVFAAGDESRSTALDKAATLAKRHAGPMIKRLMMAGRFFVFVLEKAQMPNTTFQRDLVTMTAATANAVAAMEREMGAMTSATARTIAAIDAKLDRVLSVGGHATAAVAAAVAPAEDVGGAGAVETLSANMDRLLTGGDPATAAASAATLPVGVGGGTSGKHRRQDGGGRGNGRGRRGRGRGGR